MIIEFLYAFGCIMEKSTPLLDLPFNWNFKWLGTGSASLINTFVFSIQFFIKFLAEAISLIGVKTPPRSQMVFISQIYI